MNRRVNTRIFGLSSKLFSHFKTTVYIDRVSSMKEIITLVLLDLSTLLREANLLALLDELRLCKFHYHDYNFNDVKLNPDKIFWLCEGCK